MNLCSHWHEHWRIHMMMNKRHPAGPGFRRLALGEHLKDQRAFLTRHFQRRSTESHVHRRRV